MTGLLLQVICLDYNMYFSIIRNQVKIQLVIRVKLKKLKFKV